MLLGLARLDPTYETRYETPLPSPLLIQEGADAVDRTACFRHDSRKQRPDVRHARPDLDLGATACCPQLVGHANGIVVQNLVAADQNQRRRQPGGIAV